MNNNIQEAEGLMRRKNELEAISNTLFDLIPKIIDDTGSTYCSELTTILLAIGNVQDKIYARAKYLID